VIEHAGLALATTAFVGTHLALSHPLRTRLVQNMGEAGFSGLYSIVAVLTLGWMILAWRAIEVSVPFWIAPAMVVDHGVGDHAVRVDPAGRLVREEPAFPAPRAAQSRRRGRRRACSQSPATR
jgi:hypothetical protein